MVPPAPAMGTGEPMVAMGCKAICGKVGSLGRTGLVPGRCFLGVCSSCPAGGLAMPGCTTELLGLAVISAEPVAVLCANAVPPSPTARITC